MFNKIKNLTDSAGQITGRERAEAFIRQFSDVRAVGLVVFLGIALMISWSGAQVIQRNYELQKQISRLRQENAVSQLENNNMSLQNQYLKTDQYVELEARRNFGLGQSGEKLLLVPREVALSYVTADKTANGSGQATAPSPAAQRPAYQRNFEAWVDFFLHRQAAL